VTWPISHDGEDGQTHKIPINMLYRWYLYDIVGDEANKSIKLFNLSPVSDEGNEKELEDAENRLIHISPLIPFIRLYADMNAQHSFNVHREELLKIPGVTAETLDSGAASLKNFYSNMSFNGIVALLSAAVELEIIEINGMFAGIKEEDK